MNIPPEFDEAMREEKIQKQQIEIFKGMNTWRDTMKKLWALNEPEKKKTALERIKEELEKPRDIEL
jgi:hypothetical protein